MALYKIQGQAEKRQGISYEFDPQEEPLGVGGMGRVYKGKRINEKTGSTRQVAIKFMYDDLPPHVIERARREASIQLRHENLVEMLGFIETEEKSPSGMALRRHYHVVSELLEGIMLSDLLQGKLLDRDGHVVPFAQKLYKDYQNDKYHFAAYIIRSILSGLMTLHDAGYIHRDIDPTNIMVTSDGHVKLIDFGIAKQMQSLTTHDKPLTAAGAFMGKAEYAAPELVTGDVKHQSKVTDIYAVGVLLFQCIIGHPPFEGDTATVLDMQLHKKMPYYLIRNKEMRNIIRKATQKARDKRYQSVAEFRVALDHLPLDLKDDLIVWRPAYTLVAACVACICIGGATAAIWSHSASDEASTGLMDTSLSSQSSQGSSAPSPAPVATPEPKPQVDYQDLFDQADAIYRADTETEAERQANLRQALALYEKAQAAAIAANDQIYTDSTQKMIARVKRRIK